MQNPVVVISRDSGGATDGGLTSAFNPAHIIRATVRQATKDGSYVATLHDISGQSFKFNLGPNGMTEDQIAQALEQLFKLSSIEYLKPTVTD
ncbi:hypothetical protein [Plantibacter flavus]|uniref:hypothetical protein n=1 Tax=Plantibacter flavus TaxID=150123 RepID=UPI00129469E7|nr:hypothetical protein [Plantibacter flavus]